MKRRISNNQCNISLEDVDIVFCDFIYDESTATIELQGLAEDLVADVLDQFADQPCATLRFEYGEDDAEAVEMAVTEPDVERDVDAGLATTEFSFPILQYTERP